MRITKRKLNELITKIILKESMADNRALRRAAKQKEKQTAASNAQASEYKDAYDEDDYSKLDTEQEISTAGLKDKGSVTPSEEVPKEEKAYFHSKAVKIQGAPKKYTSKEKARSGEKPDYYKQGAGGYNYLYNPGTGKLQIIKHSKKPDVNRRSPEVVTPGTEPYKAILKKEYGLTITESANKSNLIRVTRRQLKRLLREASNNLTGDRITRFYTYSESDDTFVPIQERSDDIYTYKIDWNGLNFDGNDVTSLKILIPKKSDKEFNKNFTLKAGSENVSKGVGQLISDMFSIYIKQTGTPGLDDYPYEGKNIPDSDLINNKMFVKALANFFMDKINKSGVGVGKDAGELDISQGEETASGESQSPKSQGNNTKGNKNTNKKVKGVMINGEIYQAATALESSGKENLLKIRYESIRGNPAVNPSGEFLKDWDLKIDIENYIKKMKNKNPSYLEFNKEEGQSYKTVVIDISGGVFDSATLTWQNINFKGSVIAAKEDKKNPEYALVIDAPGTDNYIITGLELKGGYIQPKNLKEY